MVSIRKNINNKNCYKENIPKYIVLHDTGYYISADYYLKKLEGDIRSSYHFIVDDDNIIQYIDLNNGSWHCGNSNTNVNNKNSISIVMCCGKDNQVSEKTELQTIELVKSLMKKFGIPLENVMTHSEVSSFIKICPMWDYDNWARWRSFKYKINGGSNNILKTSKYEDAKIFLGDKCSEVQSLLIELGYYYGKDKDNGVFNQETYHAILKFQKDNGLATDGFVGKNTIKMLYSKINLKVKNKLESFNFSDWIRRLQIECNKQKRCNIEENGKPSEELLSSCPNVREGSKGEGIKLLQERLNSLGFTTNGIDGYFGPSTTLAVKIFQKGSKLNPNGIVNKETWKKLLGMK